jgi:hypothetical protein
MRCIAACSCCGSKGDFVSVTQPWSHGLNADALRKLTYIIDLVQATHQAFTSKASHSPISLAAEVSHRGKEHLSSVEPTGVILECDEADHADAIPKGSMKSP